MVMGDQDGGQRPSGLVECGLDGSGLRRIDQDGFAVFVDENRVVVRKT